MAPGGVNRIKKLLEISARTLDFQENYDVYIMVGTGQVGGTALPAEKPFLYNWSRAVADYLAGLDFIVPQEFLHYGEMSPSLHSRIRLAGTHVWTAGARGGAVPRQEGPDLADGASTAYLQALQVREDMRHLLWAETLP